MKTVQSISTGGLINLNDKRPMNDLQKYFSTCLLATAALLGGASAAFAADAPVPVPVPGTASEAAARSAALAKAAAVLTGVLNPAKSICNQGVGNDEDWPCDPANSNQGDPSRSNDQLGGVPGSPGRKGGNK